MAFSYSGDPTNSPLDKVRFILGDTDTNAYLLSDEEINYLLSITSSAEEATYKGTLNIIAKLTNQVDYQIGPEKVWANQKLTNFVLLRKELSDLVTKSTPFPSMAEPSGKYGTQPIFDIGMNDVSTNPTDYLSRLEGRDR